MRLKIAVSVVRFRPWAPRYDILRFSTTLYDAAPVRQRNVARQLIDRSTLHWRSLVTWRGLIRRMGGYGTTAHGAKRPSSRASRPTEAKLKTNACVLRRQLRQAAKGARVSCSRHSVGESRSRN